MLPSQKCYHIALNKKIIESAKYAIMPGDPGRVKKIASLLDNPHFITQNREYTSYIGYINNDPVLVISSGMGGPAAAICVEELATCGIENIIRVGTCGGMQPNVRSGDIIIAQAAIRAEGTSREYAPIEFPACADFYITSALISSAKELNAKKHVGIVHCKDSFYGQHSPKSMPVSDELLYKWNAWKACGALASEMETAAVFTVSRIRNIRAGAVLLCIWNQDFPDDENNFDTELESKIAIKAIDYLM